MNSAEQTAVLRALAEKAGHARCRFLEIGSWCGDTAVVLGKTARDKGGRLVCIDWWKGSPGTDLSDIARQRDIFSLFWDRIRGEGLEDMVVPIRTSSDVAAELLRVGQFDLVFIDGDHRYQQVARDIRNYGPLVRPDGGVLCGHDCEGYVIDFDRPVLEAGRDADYHAGIHCGVILAVGEAFPAYSVNHGIWSVQAAGGQWKPTRLTLPGAIGSGEAPPAILEQYFGYNLIRYRGRICGVAQAAGALDIAALSDRELEALRERQLLTFAASLEQAREWVRQHGEPALLGDLKRFNLVGFRGKVFAVAQQAGPLDLKAASPALLNDLASRGLLHVTASVESARRWVNERQ